MSANRFLRQCQRIRYYAGASAALLVPDAWYRSRRERLLAGFDPADPGLAGRIDHCCRLDASVRLPDGSLRSADLHWGRQTTYFFDLNSILRWFPRHHRVAWRFGDITQVPEVPAFVKSRPISGDNRNAVLLRLNQVRHFAFVHDPVPYRAKRDRLVWRGKAKGKPNRMLLLDRFLDHPRCDVGDTTPRNRGERTWRPFMSVREQLANKFILSLEGNDVGTNLKWIMGSNSLCFATRLRYETWFMEGRLEPGRHFVLVRDDLADLEERMDHYLARPDEAEEIIRRANTWVEQFRDPRRELWLSLKVAEKYLSLVS
jgi:hypothetical protein